MLYLTVLTGTAQSMPFVLNNPYPAEESTQNIYYTSFSEQPKTLDPAKSYASNEYQFLAQILEPLLQYDYLARPYQLVPLTAAGMPTVRYLDADGKEVSATAGKEIAKSVYTVAIHPGILYQPHPAFAMTFDGRYHYANLSKDYLRANEVTMLRDFKFTGTRELEADDYVYEIKRLANPAISSPIYGLMSEHILGFKEYGSTLPGHGKVDGFLDLRQYPMMGVKALDKYTLEITLIGPFQQFGYWLAMPFFAPVPWEVDRFYSEPDMDDKNIVFGWYPVGTGPFMLSENNPNSQMILERNPNYRADYFLATGSEADRQSGVIHHLGMRIPFIDKAVFTLEKEAIPRWNKFLQGYYDLSGISSDNFDQAIAINSVGASEITPEMKEKKIRLEKSIDPSVFYFGFNMLDPVVGGNSERARKLRLAISIALNYEEFINIFLNGRGHAAQGPIPPGIFGYRDGQAGINPYVYRWQGDHLVRRSIMEAKELMTEAGYPNGRDPITGKPLILHFDVAASGGPDEKSQLNWMSKQFAKIGIALNIRSTQYNRFQEKMRTGNAQLFSWGWNADYPDPENFLFLLYGENGKVKAGGENAANYTNPRYDALFLQMKNLPNGPERQALIDEMITLIRHDAPWVFGVNSESYVLSQQWVSPTKPNSMAMNTLKFLAIDVPLRNRMRVVWNQPVIWPIALVMLFIALLLFPFFLAYLKKQKAKARRVLV